jgi:hypothetical protein
MRRAPEQVHHARALVLHGFDGELGVRVQSQHGLIEQREIGPAAVLDADGVARENVSFSLIGCQDAWPAHRTSTTPWTETALATKPVGACAALVAGALSARIATSATIRWIGLTGRRRGQSHSHSPISFGSPSLEENAEEYRSPDGVTSTWNFS